jgi:hypothetical protein
MTETAKQDATKTPAEPAATESAATKGKAEPDTAGPDTAPESAEAAAAAAEPAASDIDETKRKFREALERKHQAHNDGQDKGGHDGGKINGAHGPAASRRNFRRKSG